MIIDAVERSRKDRILEFIRENKEVTRSQITRFATDKFATKKTVDRIAIELLEEGAIIESRKNPNSRNKYLTINNENQLQDLEFEASKIKIIFTRFIERFTEIYSQPPHLWPHHPSYEMNYSYAKLMIQSMVNIPFAIVSIIEKIYRYKQIVLWNKFDESLFKKLLMSSFQIINQLLSAVIETTRILINKKYQNNNPKVTFPIDEFNAVHNTYDRYTIRELIPLLRHRCISIGLVSEYDSLIEHLLLANMDYFGRIIPFIVDPYNEQYPDSPFRNKTRMEIIHDYNCPARDSEKCDLLDHNPLYSDFKGSN